MAQREQIWPVYEHLPPLSPTSPTFLLWTEGVFCDAQVFLALRQGGSVLPILSNIYNLEHISVPFEKQHVCTPSPCTHWATRKTFTWCLTKILPGHWMPSCKTAASNSFDISMNCDVILRCVQLRAAQWSIPSESLQNLYWEKLMHLLPSFQILREINI